jgi:ribosomal protein S21
MSVKSDNENNLESQSKGGDYEKIYRDIGEPVEFRPLEVKVKDGNFDRAFKAFRAIVQKEKIVSLYKERSRYEKPSDRRRRKRKESERKFFELKFKDKLAEKRRTQKKTKEKQEDS